jgi:uncharacterized protein YcfJ
MNRLMVKALAVGIAAALTVGVSGCNRSADAGTSAAAPMSAATNAPADDLAAGNAATDVARAGDNGVRYAKVVSVDPVRESVNNPKQVCRDEVVSHTEPPKDQHRIAGTAIGAVVGGLVGNQVGGGSGKTLATVAGAVGGGYAGNRIEASRQHGQVTSSVQRHCSTVNRSSNKVVGYDVRYVYNGVTRTVRMDHDPGDRVQVQEGVIAVSDAR